MLNYNNMLSRLRTDFSKAEAFFYMDGADAVSKAEVLYEAPRINC
jgi:hypothetical protein